MTTTRRDNEDTPFGAWLRSQPILDSGYGYDAQNADYFWHNYKTGQLMFIEEKRHKAVRSFSQKDTHGIVNRGLERGFRSGPGEIKNKRGETIEYCGYHVIQFENTSPDDGNIYIDGGLVTVDQLLLFLQFEAWR